MYSGRTRVKMYAYGAQKPAVGETRLKPGSNAIGLIDVRDAMNVKEKRMKILIHLSSAIISEAIRLLLSENGLEAHNGSPNAGFRPDIVLVDVNTVSTGLFSTFPDSKVLLLDTGIKKEKLAQALLSYEISGT